MLLLEQVEWLLFQANLADIGVDKRLLDAMIGVRRIISGTETENTDFISLADDVFFENGGYKAVNNPESFNLALIAHACDTLAGDVSFLGHAVQEWGGIDYITSCYMGSDLFLKQKGPLATWIEESV